MKGCLESLIIKEKQIKAIMRYHPNTHLNGCYSFLNDKKCWWGYGIIQTHVHHQWEYKILQLLWKIICIFLKKIKHITNIWFCSPTSEHISKSIEIRISKRYLHSYIHCSTIHNTQNMITNYMFISGYLLVYNHKGILFGFKNRRKFCHIWQHGCAWRTLYLMK